jgi:tetratricopeptide (TPR) repeat protein
MHPLRRSGGIEVPPAEIARITDLYARGLYLQAYEIARSIGPLTEWQGIAGRLIGGRLAGNLGSRKVGELLHMRAWAADRTHLEAIYFYAYSVLTRRGPLAAWKFLLKFPESTWNGSEVGADVLALKGRVVASFRDFERAGRWLDEAEQLGSNQVWLWCERAAVLEMQDRYEAAMEAAQHALSLRPWFRPAVQQLAQSYQLLNRDDDARALLIEASRTIESGSCNAQLSVLLEEAGDFAGAIAAWEDNLRLSPLYDDVALQGWHARMADLHYLSGRRSIAIEHARKTPADSWQQEMADRLEAEPDSTRRVHLRVGFVRQHHVTCVPATLSAVAAYLGKTIDHLALAREITYDGTPDHVERAWLEANGFVAREFRLTWEVAVALLDRGIPFTLTTTEINSGHLQAVIGYDVVRRTLLIRDPYLRWHSEFNVAPLLERYAPFGPRAMVFLPAEDAARLQGIELPEAALYDGYYHVRRALHHHARSDAQVEADKLAASDPAHRLALFAQRDIAFYDGNVPRQLAVTDALLQLHPECGNFLRGKLYALRELAHRAEYTEFLQTLVKDEVDPSFWCDWAHELSLDARRAPDACRWMQRCLRFRSADPENLAGMANLLWDDRQFERALEFYRLAACLRDTVDSFSRSYFLAARHLRQTDAALNWLRERFARDRGKSIVPTQGLYWALQTLDRSEEAMAVLEEALALRPDDGELLLYAADAHGRADRRVAQISLWARRSVAAPALRFCARQRAWRITGAICVARARYGRRSCNSSRSHRMRSGRLSASSRRFTGVPRRSRNSRCSPSAFHTTFRCTGFTWSGVARRERPSGSASPGARWRSMPVTRGCGGN